MINTIVIAMGANLGNREQQIGSAFESLIKLSKGKKIKQSGWYYSKALLHPDNPQPQPDYCNCVASFTSSILPGQLLALIKRIEKGQGRDFNLPVWSARPIDIDIVAYGNIQWRSSKLVIPHASYKERDFVINPWKEIDPQVVI